MTRPFVTGLLGPAGIEFLNDMFEYYEAAGGGGGTALGAEITAASAKTPLVNADRFGIADSAAADATKKVTWETVKTGIPVFIPIACGDETTALTAGVGKVTFRIPFAMTLTGVSASVNTAPTGGTLLTVDINEGGTTILSTKLTFDASEKTTTTAATPAVISDTSLAADAEVSIDIDAIGSTVAGAGLKVYLLGYKT